MPSARAGASSQREGLDSAVGWSPYIVPKRTMRRRNDDMQHADLAQDARLEAALLLCPCGCGCERATPGTESESTRLGDCGCGCHELSAKPAQESSVRCGCGCCEG